MAAITVAQLREALTDVPDTAIVVLAKDSEGNSFSPVEDGERSFSLNFYRAHNTWSGEIDEYDPINLPLALIIWPTN